MEQLDRKRPHGVSSGGLPKDTFSNLVMRRGWSPQRVGQSGVDRAGLLWSSVRLWSRNWSSDKSCVSSGTTASCLMAVRQRETQQEQEARAALRHLDLIHVCGNWKCVCACREEGREGGGQIQTAQAGAVDGGVVDGQRGQRWEVCVRLRLWPSLDQKHTEGEEFTHTHTSVFQVCVHTDQWPMRSFLQ